MSDGEAERPVRGEAERPARGEDGSNKKGGAVDRWKEYFISKGLTPVDIPIAIGVHEAVGISWLLGSWAACYSIEPTKRIGSMAMGDRVKRAMETAEKKLVRWSSWLSRVPGLKSADRARLIVSLAESSVVRNVARPAMVPLKLWLAWKAVMLTKPALKPPA